MARHRWGVAAAWLGASLALGACQPARQPKTGVITIDQLAFGAAPADLHVGDTVRWVNKDMFEHTATAKDGQFDLDMPAGASAEVVLRQPGIIAYDCKLHPGMTGQLNVAE